MQSLHKALLFALAVILLGVAAFAIWDHLRPLPGPSPATRQLQDSLKVTKPQYEARRDSLKATETREVAQGTKADARSHASEAVARDRAHLADSLAQLARVASSARDSARFWQAAYEEKGKALTSALTALSEAREVGERERGARLAAQTRADEAERRIEGLERLNAGLAKDLAAAQRAARCRVAGLVPCPSRTVAALLAASGAYLLSREDVRERVKDALRQAVPGQ